MIDISLLSNNEIIVGDLKKTADFFQVNVKGKMHSEMLMTINLLVCVYDWASWAADFETE